MFSSLQFLGSPTKSRRWMMPCLLQVVPRMTRDILEWRNTLLLSSFLHFNILAHFGRSKTLKSISCLSRERSLKSYFPLLLPMPGLTLSGLEWDWVKSPLHIYSWICICGGLYFSIGITLWQHGRTSRVGTSTLEHIGQLQAPDTKHLVHFPAAVAAAGSLGNHPNSCCISVLAVLVWAAQENSMGQPADGFLCSSSKPFRPPHSWFSGIWLYSTTLDYLQAVFWGLPVETDMLHLLDEQVVTLHLKRVFLNQTVTVVMCPKERCATWLRGQNDVGRKERDLSWGQVLIQTSQHKTHHELRMKPINQQTLVNVTGRYCAAGISCSPVPQPRNCPFSIPLLRLFAVTGRITIQSSIRDV